MQDLPGAARPCGEPIHYLMPTGDFGEVPCELPSWHTARHDSSQLLLRPADTVSIPLEWL